MPAEIARVQISDNLMAIYREHLVPWFHQLDEAMHPWWWPRGSGDDIEDWGLSETDLLRSLKFGPNGAVPAGSQYPRFPGSVCAEPTSDVRHTVFILSSRPSRKAFPNLNGSTTWLYEVLVRANLLAGAHVTDLVKFRGPGPDASADEGIDKPTDAGLTLRQGSFLCFMEEFNYLRPCTVVLAGGKVQKWITHRVGLGLSDGERQFIEQMRLRAVSVTSWMATTKDGKPYSKDDIAREWREKITAKCPQHKW